MRPRRTFLVQVLDESGVALVENARTRERVQLEDLSHVEAQISAWLADDRSEPYPPPRGSGPILDRP